MGKAARTRLALAAISVCTCCATAAGGAVASERAAFMRSAFARVAGVTPVTQPLPQIAAPSLKNGSTVAGIQLGAWARSRPGAGRRVWWVGQATSWAKEPQILLVLGSAYRKGREYLRVLLPIRPDGTSGWIPRDNVMLMQTRYWITVNKRAKSVTVYRDGKQLRRFRAVIGKPATPTPDGLAAIWEEDHLSNPSTNFLGSWALQLTVFSPVLMNFDGGPGRVAIHGRGGASLLDPLGSARSHGCIRLANDSIDWIARRVPQGTPVMIKG